MPHETYAPYATDDTPYEFDKLDALRQLRELLPDRRILFDLVDDDVVLATLLRNTFRNRMNAGRCRSQTL